jgi:hypothetical protein
MSGRDLKTIQSEPAGRLAEIVARRCFRRDKPGGSLSMVLRLFVVSFLSSSLLGCGGSDHLALAPVTGKVTLDGKPVSEGTILFRPDMGRAGRGKIENGAIVEASTYGINDGIVLGTHKIAIQPIPDIPPPAPSRVQGIDTPTPAYMLNLRPASAKVAIPAKYQDVDQSGLTFEIKDDDNELNIELTSQ